MKTYKESIKKRFLLGTKKTYAKNDVILSAKQKPEGVFYISEGLIKVCLQNSRNETYIHIIFGPGDIFPISWLIQETKSNLSYLAMTNVTCFIVDKEELLKNIATDQTLCLAFLAKSVDKTEIFKSRVDNLVYKYARERLAYRLLYLAKRFGVKKNSTYTLPVSINQQIIGSSINLSRESVGREMERLSARGIVAYQGKHITILDSKALANEIKDVASIDWWGLDI